MHESFAWSSSGRGAHEDLGLLVYLHVPTRELAVGESHALAAEAALLPRDKHALDRQRVMLDCGVRVLNL